jgi:hypothetical protein
MNLLCRLGFHKREDHFSDYTVCLRCGKIVMNWTLIR